MPHRRPAKKGSFSGHFDQLVEHFGHSSQAKLNGGQKRQKPARSRKISVHERLLEASRH